MERVKEKGNGRIRKEEKKGKRRQREGRQKRRRGVEKREKSSGKDSAEKGGEAEKWGGGGKGGTGEKGRKGWGREAAEPRGDLSFQSDGMYIPVINRDMERKREYIPVGYVKGCSHILICSQI